MLKIMGTLSDVRQGLRFEKPVCDAYVVVAGGVNYGPSMYQISLPDDGSSLKPFVGKEVELCVVARAWKDRIYYDFVSYGALNEKK